MTTRSEVALRASSPDTGEFAWGSGRAIPPRCVCDAAMPGRRGRPRHSLALSGPPPVTSYLVLLRGINVGGKNKVSMAELKKCLEELEFSDVSTFIVSGNVVLTSDR